MLLVILGAGASYDSVPAFPASATPGDPDRPPLADFLFSDRPQFDPAIRRFPTCHPIIPLLRSRGGQSVEEVLALLAAEAHAHPERHRQLMAVRYYIQHILWGAADQWAGNRAAGVTNYKALLDRIRRWVGPEELVAVATFNYDTLVEHALMAEGMSFPTMASFIENPRYKLFKLHGSVSWCRVVDYLPDPWPERESDDLFMRALTLKAPELRITNTYCVVQNCPTGLFERRPAIPAIAVPIAGKSEFECPTDHVGLLRTLLPQTKRIVIVGWRAGEAHFLELLRAALPPGVPSLIACGSRSDANMTSDTIKAAGVHTNSHTLDGGFTELIVRRELDGFLADYWKAT